MVVVVVHPRFARSKTSREVTAIDGSMVDQRDPFDKGEQSLVEARRQNDNR